MARRATVLAIGGANLDIKCRPGVPYRAGTSNPGVIEISAGGVANNVARNLGLLGIRVSLVSAIGRDNAGQRLLLEARRAGVNAALCRRSLRRPTGAYVALLDERGELVGAVSDMAIMDELGPGKIRAILPALGRCDIAVADCNLPQATLALLARAANAREIPLVTMPCRRPRRRREAARGGPACSRFAERKVAHSSFLVQATLPFSQAAASWRHQPRSSRPTSLFGIRPSPDFGQRQSGAAIK
jgi:pseudouridine kinase